MKRCKLETCRIRFTPKFNTLEKCCSVEHAIEWARENPAEVAKLKRSGQRAEKRIARVAMRTVSDWIALVQADVNRFVRIRDRDEGCISCDVPSTYTGRGLWGRQWHASHYMPAGVNAAIRFDYANIHKSCSQCNSEKSGNRGPYRVRLIAKIGLSEVERLEGPKEIKRWTIPELIEIRKDARRRIKEMEKRQELAA